MSARHGLPLLLVLPTGAAALLATVCGTRWLVEDRCDGTLTRVARGEVEVEEFTVACEPAPAPSPGAEPQPVTGESGGIVVQGGDSYVARPGS